MDFLLGHSDFKIAFLIKLQLYLFVYNSPFMWDCFSEDTILLLCLGVALGDSVETDLDSMVNKGLEFGTFLCSMQFTGNKSTPSSSSQWKGCRSE